MSDNCCGEKQYTGREVRLNRRWGWLLEIGWWEKSCLRRWHLHKHLKDVIVRVSPLDSQGKKIAEMGNSKCKVWREACLAIQSAWRSERLEHLIQGKEDWQEMRSERWAGRWHIWGLIPAFSCPFSEVGEQLEELEQRNDKIWLIV